MRISLLTVPFDPFERIWSLGPEYNRQRQHIPNLGITALVNWMEKRGYPREMCDFYDLDLVVPTLDEIERYFKDYQPDVVGLSAIVSTSYSNVKMVAEAARRFAPNALIVIGGNMTAGASVILNKTAADLCVVGDGEVPWVAILDYAKRYGRARNLDVLRNIPGLTFLDETGEMEFTAPAPRPPGSELAYPDYALMRAGARGDEEKFNWYLPKGLDRNWFVYDQRSWTPGRPPRQAHMVTSKGCVARCTFCERPTVGYRNYDLERLDEHLGMLRRDLDVGFINLFEENFGSNKKHSYEVARLFKKHDMMWVAGGTRVTNVTYEDLKFYQENQCSGLKFGVESGSQTILDVMEKKFTVQQVRSALVNCGQLRLMAPVAVMAGMPGETLETARETGAFIGDIAHSYGTPPHLIGGVGAFYALPMPGTPLYEYGQQTGLIPTDIDGEEAYLNSLAYAGSDKLHYLNLNGAPIQEILFWDILMALEANRTFYRKMKEEPRPPLGIYEVTVAPAADAAAQPRLAAMRKALQRRVERLRTRLSRETASGLLAKLVTGMYIERQIMRNVVLSPMVARLPAAPVDFILKYAIYAEYRLGVFILRLFGLKANKALFDRPDRADDRLSGEKQFTKQGRTHSLRTVVHRERKEPRSKSELNSRSLYA